MITTVIVVPEPKLLQMAKIQRQTQVTWTDSQSKDWSVQIAFPEPPPPSQAVRMVTWPDCSGWRKCTLLPQLAAHDWQSLAVPSHLYPCFAYY